VREFEQSLEGELFEFAAVGELLEMKATLISGKYPDLTVKPTVDFMKELTKQYKSLLEDRPDAEVSCNTMTVASGVLS
jgi:hypothetical protein